MGHGYDVHRLAPGRRLILGGVTIPHDLGLEGYSDGDVLIHAVIDALLGAANLGDIGTHFPSSDPQYRDAPSTRLLAATVGLLRRHSWQIVNLDVTIAAEHPKLAQHISAMRDTVAATAELDSSRVSIKATTTDGLGLTGRGEGLAAWAVALLEEQA